MMGTLKTFFACGHFTRKSTPGMPDQQEWSQEKCLDCWKKDNRLVQKHTEPLVQFIDRRLSQGR